MALCISHGYLVSSIEVALPKIMGIGTNMDINETATSKLDNILNSDYIAVLFPMHPPTGAGLILYLNHCTCFCSGGIGRQFPSFAKRINSFTIWYLITIRSMSPN